MCGKSQRRGFVTRVMPLAGDAVGISGADGKKSVVTRSTALLLFAVAALQGACNTSLKVRGDAGNAVDGSADAPADRAADAVGMASGDVAADLARLDLGPLGIPSAFRFDNDGNQTVYVRADSPVGCRTRAASGWQACSFFRLNCMKDCEEVSDRFACCITCGQELPAVYPIPAHSSRRIPWGGFIFTSTYDTCACGCQEAVPAGGGELAATARGFGDYECSSQACSIGSDGTIQNASGRGAEVSLSVPFVVPLPEPEIVFHIALESPPDAGTVSDASRIDIPPDAAGLALAELAGRTFQIAAADAFPDASVPGAVGCVPSDPAARYTLAFSADGTQVKISRADPVQEVNLNGTLDRQSESQIVYRLDAFAGGELIVKAGHVAQLVIFGSGRPVLSCTEAPMKP
jgi:hypothetical protein